MKDTGILLYQGFPRIILSFEMKMREFISKNFAELVLFYITVTLEFT